MIILIPAYEPGAHLLELIGTIHAADPGLTLVVVDDGSGPAYRHIFDGAARLGCRVISYPVNRGKGHALKAGFGFIAGHFPGQDVVCADSDGQHSVVDILRVAERAGGTTTAMVLGSRSFAGDVPARSRFGNAATRWLFRLATGERVQDTQTGLRGYPATMLPWLRSVRGERYEYELNVLLEAKAAGYGIDSVDIATIYLNGPENDGNGALDVNGELAVSGGTLAAAGSSGMAVTPGSSSTQSGVQVTFGSTQPAGTTVQLADATGKLVATFVTAKSAASLVFSSAAIEAGKEYTVYTGGTAKAESGLGEGSLDGAEKLGTVTAGEYTQAHGPGGR